MDTAGRGVIMRISYTLGRITKGVAKAALPVGKWATQQAANITSEFVRGMAEQPTITKVENIDEEIKQELASEPVQPELPLEHPEQPTRSSV